MVPPPPSDPDDDDDETGVVTAAADAETEDSLPWLVPAAPAPADEACPPLILTLPPPPPRRPLGAAHTAKHNLAALKNRFFSGL